MNDAWLQITREAGALGLAALMAWRINLTLERVIAVLYRMEGVLMNREADKGTPGEIRRQL